MPLRRTSTALLLASISALALPAAASALPQPSYSFALNAAGFNGTLNLFCGNATESTGSVAFTKVMKNGELGSDFFGGKSSCSKDSVKLDWGSAGSLNLKITKRGKRRRVPLAKGCSGPHPEIQDATGTGTVDLKLPRPFNRVRKSKLNATITWDFPGVRCKTPTAPSDLVGLSVDAPNGFISATKPRRGPRTLYVSATGPRLNRKVFSDNWILVQGGAGMFSFSSNFNSATVTPRLPFGKGKIKFTATPACPGKQHSRTGHATGGITIFGPTATTTVRPTQLFLASLIQGSQPPCTGSP